MSRNSSLGSEALSCCYRKVQEGPKANDGPLAISISFNRYRETGTVEEGEGEDERGPKPVTPSKVDRRILKLLSTEIVAAQDWGGIHVSAIRSCSSNVSPHGRSSKTATLLGQQISPPRLVLGDIYRCDHHSPESPEVRGFGNIKGAECSFGLSNTKLGRRFGAASLVECMGRSTSSPRTWMRIC